MFGILASPNKTSPVKTSATRNSSLWASSIRILADGTSPLRGLVALMSILLPLGLFMGEATAAEAPLARDSVARETPDYGPETTYYGRYYGLSARTRNAQSLSSRLGAKQEPAPGAAEEGHEAPQPPGR